MLRRVTMTVLLLAFTSSAVGAQELSMTKLESDPQPLLNVADPDPAAAEKRPETVKVALNDPETPPAGETKETPRKTHYGLSFREFIDVHFGDYRWAWWALAAGVLVGIHVAH